MAYLANFHLWAPRMIKDSETPVWLGLMGFDTIEINLAQLI